MNVFVDGCMSSSVTSSISFADPSSETSKKFKSFFLVVYWRKRNYIPRILIDVTKGDVTKEALLHF